MLFRVGHVDPIAWAEPDTFSEASHMPKALRQMYLDQAHIMLHAAHDPEAPTQVKHTADCWLENHLSLVASLISLERMKN